MSHLCQQLTPIPADLRTTWERAVSKGVKSLAVKQAAKIFPASFHPGDMHEQVRAGQIPIALLPFVLKAMGDSVQQSRGAWKADADYSSLALWLADQLGGSKVFTTPYEGAALPEELVARWRRQEVSDKSAVEELATHGWTEIDYGFTWRHFKTFRKEDVVARVNLNRDKEIPAEELVSFGAATLSTSFAQPLGYKNGILYLEYVGPLTLKNTSPWGPREYRPLSEEAIDAYIQGLSELQQRGLRWTSPWLPQEFGLREDGSLVTIGPELLPADRDVRPNDEYLARCREVLMHNLSGNSGMIV